MMNLSLTERWRNRLAVVGLILIGVVGGSLGKTLLESGGILPGSEDAAAPSGSSSLLSLVESSAIASSPAWLDSAARGNRMSLATGQVNEGIEAIFALDHETGNLFCWVLDPRNLALTAEFSTNVQVQMGLAGGGDHDYVMATGQIFFQGGRAGNFRPANCVVYVAEGKSGQVSGFSFGWAQPLAVRGTPQRGPMNMVFSGTVRGPLASRDQ